MSSRPVSPDVEMHVCGTCDSHLVQPLDWQPLASECWQVTLRCPECESCATGAFTAEECEAFDEELERGTDAIVCELAALETANFADEIERFALALQADLILPEDF
jgi:hypothetical protein